MAAALPGSYLIRPSRQDAEDDIEAFHALLEWVQRHRGLTNRKLAEIIGDQTLNSDANMSKRISKQTLSAAAQRLILNYIFDTGKVIAGGNRTEIEAIKHNLFFAVLGFFNAKETSQDKARARAIGTYRLWRYSVTHPDEFVFGKISFTEDPETGALEAAMKQVLRSKEQVTVTTEDFGGYLFRLCHMYCMVLADSHHNDIRITLFPEHKLSHVGTDVHPRSIFPGSVLHVTYMDGYCFGVDGGKGFFSPVHLALEDNVDRLATLDDELDVVAEGDPRIPDRVLKKLRLGGPLKRL